MTLHAHRPWARAEWMRASAGKRCGLLSVVEAGKAACCSCSWELDLRQHMGGGRIGERAMVETRDDRIGKEREEEEEERK